MTDQTRTLGDAEVALLGLLAERPKHPWQIQKDVEHRDMRSWSDLSTSTIYKRLRALEKGGLVASSTEVVDGRARNIYSLTDAGRKALV
jgi:DNA-binding PadR family transcriptional regulator